MIEEPKCFTRGCVHFIGVKNNGNEMTERVVCKAFPNGIPNEIAYGDNKHTQSYPGDHGLRFERS